MNRELAAKLDAAYIALATARRELAAVVATRKEAEQTERTLRENVDTQEANFNRIMHEVRESAR